MNKKSGSHLATGYPPPDSLKAASHTSEPYRDLVTLRTIESKGSANRHGFSLLALVVLKKGEKASLKDRRIGVSCSWFLENPQTSIPFTLAASMIRTFSEGHSRAPSKRTNAILVAMRSPCPYIDDGSQGCEPPDTRTN